LQQRISPATACKWNIRRIVRVEREEIWGKMRGGGERRCGSWNGRGERRCGQTNFIAKTKPFCTINCCRPAKGCASAE
jgi:hypothetical protein